MRKPDINRQKSRAEDRGESIGLMEPMLIGDSSKHRTELADLALELTAKSTSLRSSLPEGIVAALSRLVRAMNCYYSNLIEGHDTHPVDIERALEGEYSSDPKTRDLQLEAKAHIAVQAWIDEDGMTGLATSAENILGMHRRFCELLPDDLLWAENPETKERVHVEPGQFRTHDVKVGRHIPVSPGALPRFLKRFEEAYARLGRVDAILAAASAHHRLLWMHPFLDGNGRVARLMSYAMLRDALQTGGLWSIARGFARNEAQYKEHLAACDLKRRNDLDGRGQLSEEAIASFIRFFLTTCIDQVSFMESLMQPDRLRDRILIWAEEEIRGNRLPPNSDLILKAILYRGELPRGEIPTILGATDRHARRLAKGLQDAGVLSSPSPRAPYVLNFPASLAGRWMPGLFPEK